MEQENLSQVSKSSILEFPDVITAEELFSYWLAIDEPPSRYFMEVLSFFVHDDLHK